MPEALQDAYRMGLGEEELTAISEALGRAQGVEAFDGVWPQNRLAVQAFLAVATQWRWVPAFVGDGVQLVRTGLDYGAAAAGLAAEGVIIRPETWTGLRILEAEVLKATEP